MNIFTAATFSKRNSIFQGNSFNAQIHKAGKLAIVGLDGANLMSVSTKW